MISWPAAPFPIYPISEGYQELPGDPTVRMDTDVGPLMTFRKASKAMTSFIAVYELSSVVLTNRARDLWRLGSPTGCSFGNETINWPSPRADGAFLVAYMVAKPQISHIGGLVWQVAYAMQVLE